MKELKDIDKRKKSRIGRGEISIVNFFKHWKIATDLLDEIHKKIKSKEMIQQARRQYIISLITAMEVFLKDTFIGLIDVNQFDYEKASIETKKFTLMEIANIGKQNFTMAEIIAEFYNFQNLGSIGKAFSSLLKMKFFDKLEKESSYFHDERENQFFMFQNQNFYEEIQKWIDLRHDLVHDINYEIKLTPAMTEQASFDLRAFINHINQVLIIITSNIILEQAKNNEKTRKIKKQK